MPPADALEDLQEGTLTVEFVDHELARLRKRLRKTTNVDKRREIRAQMDEWLDQRLAISPKG